MADFIVEAAGALLEELAIAQGEVGELRLVGVMVVAVAQVADNRTLAFGRTLTSTEIPAENQADAVQVVKDSVASWLHADGAVVAPMSASRLVMP